MQDALRCCTSRHSSRRVQSHGVTLNVFDCCFLVLVLAADYDDDALGTLKTRECPLSCPWPDELLPPTINKCIIDDTKAAARQSLNCIKNKTIQKAQLSQRDRATLRIIEYFAKSLKVTQSHLK